MPAATTAAGALRRALRRYARAPIGERLFVHGRAFLSNLALVEGNVPQAGFIVDLGCGHGLFAWILREASPTRRVLGIDLDPRKVDIARNTIQDGDSLRFEVGDIVADTPPRCDAVTIVDVLYLLPFEEQERVLRNAAAALSEGGPLVVKGHERRRDLRYALTYWQELVTVNLGLTKGGRKCFFFPTRAEGIAMLERAGFVADVVEMPNRIYTDVLYVARKAPLKSRSAARPLDDAD
jgi:2-polyprenyl-6-hydroxyphenyl methylase/3-demethylubiquinone-9 3-methyltransferase